MPLSPYIDAKILDNVFSQVAMPAIANVYVALSTGLQSAAVAEPTAGTGGYARVTVANNATNWPAATVASPSVKSNGVAITFATSTGAWSSGASALQSFAIYDAATAGNLLCQGSITPATDIVNGTGVTMSFAVGALVINQT